MQASVSPSARSRPKRWTSDTTCRMSASSLGTTPSSSARSPTMARHGTPRDAASSAAPPTTLPSNDCSSRKPSAVTTRSASSTRSGSSSSSAMASKPSSSVPPAAASPPASPPAAPAPSSTRTSTPWSSRYTWARRSRRRRSSSTWAAVAPFWGAKTSAASTNDVRTSHITSSSMPRSFCSGYSARRAPRPPSVVAEPPSPTRIRRAPSSMAWAISSPVPTVEAATGSLPSGPPTRSRPEARDISMTALRPSRRQPASTGSPSGPVTRVVRLGPPKTSRVPSPPSATGRSAQFHPSAAAARPTAAATSAAVAVPRNLSGAATTRIARVFTSRPLADTATRRRVGVGPDLAQSGRVSARSLASRRWVWDRVPTGRRDDATS
jgi:hypothetical protein